MKQRESLIPKQVPVSTRGFSLVEVLVALVVVSVGLLGIAATHALAYSSTAIASQRSLAAIAASSLASAIHANRGYWSSGSAPVPITITTTSTSVTISDSTLSNVKSCTSTTNPCTTTEMAAYDLQNWAASLGTLLPNAGATISCPTVSTPITCNIVLSWSEKVVAINKQTNTAVRTTDYQMFVEP